MTQPVNKPAPDEPLPDWVLHPSIPRAAIMRTCIGCGQTDNHPKIIKATTGAPAAEIYWHHDCYVIAKAGDDWPDIAALLQGADGTTGHQLRLHLMRTTGGDQQPQEVSE